MDNCKCRKKPNQKRTLDEFPMEHTREDIQRLFQERRELMANQRENLNSTNGESNTLKSYGQKRFETALSIKDNESLPPPSPDETRIFWSESRPSWSKPPFKRYNSVCSQPVTNAVKVSDRRPYSGPCLGTTSSSTPIGALKKHQMTSPTTREFNHLRKTSSAYPTLRQKMMESNNLYRLVCPSLPTRKENGCLESESESCERCNRPTVDCVRNDDYIFVPLEDDDGDSQKRKSSADSNNIIGANEMMEDQMMRNSLTQSQDNEESCEHSPSEECLDDTENTDEMQLFQPGRGSAVRESTVTFQTEDKLEQSESSSRANKKTNVPPKAKATVAGGKSPKSTKDEETKAAAAPAATFAAIEEEKDDDEPGSPWRCWVDDATVSSVESMKQDQDLAHLDELLFLQRGGPSQAPPTETHEKQENPEKHHEETEHHDQSSKHGHHSPEKHDNTTRKSGRKSSNRKSVFTPDRRSKSAAASKAKKRETVGNLEKHELPPVVITASAIEQQSEGVFNLNIETPPPPPPSLHLAATPPPVLVLPNYICPSSVEKSNMTEIKLWLQKTTFSAANRMLPMH